MNPAHDADYERGFLRSLAAHASHRLSSRHGIVSGWRHLMQRARNTLVTPLFSHCRQTSGSIRHALDAAAELAESVRNYHEAGYGDPRSEAALAAWDASQFDGQVCGE